jgi:hypothetical protein
MPSSMADPGRSGPPTPGYETRDVNTTAVLGFLVFLLLVLALTMFGVWKLFRHYSAAEHQPVPAFFFENVRQVPSGPDLEVNAREDLLQIYSKQQQELETYSWEDRKAGTVRIPIERAMDLLLQKGLPVVPTTNTNKDARAPEDTASGTEGAPGRVPGGDQ